MSCKFVPTLEDITSRRVALFLYNDPEISRLSECEPFEDPTTEWNDLVNEKISKLFLPAPLQRRLFVTASSDCLWIARYYAVHHKYSSYSLFCGNQCQCLKRIILNSYLQPSDGLFDKQKFFEDLVRDQRIDMAFRLMLATEFTIVQKWGPHIPRNLVRIFELWKHLGEDGRTVFNQDFPDILKGDIIELFLIDVEHFEYFRDDWCPDYVSLVM